MAGFLAGCSSVVDLGAGTQSLRRMVAAQYFPVDMVALGPDTIRVDFDGEWSASDIPDADGVAIAGLLEHVADPLGVVRKIAPIGRVWAVSYMDSARHPAMRLVGFGELEAAFRLAGMAVDRVESWSAQRIYRLERR